MKEKTLQKQQSNINRIFTKTNQKWSFSDMTKRNLIDREDSSNNLDTNKLLLQIVHLLNKVLLPPGAAENIRTHTQRQSINLINAHNA
jgi:hypothetical protein